MVKTRRRVDGACARQAEHTFTPPFLTHEFPTGDERAGVVDSKLDLLLSHPVVVICIVDVGLFAGFSVQDHSAPFGS